MKSRIVIKAIEEQGYRFLRHGSRHDIYTNGENDIQIPRHKDINEQTAKDILRQAGRDL